MKNLKILSLLICFSLISLSTYACKSCGCSASKEHSHSKNSIKKDVMTSKSTVKWIGKKFTGSHEGNIEIKDAHLHFENETLTGGNVIMDMSSIICTDLEGEQKEQLEGHLKSNDFFGVKKFPTANLEILSTTKLSKNKYKINGVIEIKGIKKEIEFNADIQNGLAKADIMIDRSEFDVRYGSGSFFDNLGDNVIYDEFNLSVAIYY
tara:strand:- start:16932 stop:17552 length:621 start_codon:yes stop_codon:yes gene_type:complete